MHYSVIQYDSIFRELRGQNLNNWAVLAPSTEQYTCVVAPKTLKTGQTLLEMSLGAADICFLF